MLQLLSEIKKQLAVLEVALETYLHIAFGEETVKYKHNRPTILFYSYLLAK